MKTDCQTWHGTLFLMGGSWSTLRAVSFSYANFIVSNFMYVVTVFQVYSKSNEWKLLVRWSISFCNETKVYDETDSKLLNLVSAVISFLHFVLHHHNKITKP